MSDEYHCMKCWSGKSGTYFGESGFSSTLPSTPLPEQGEITLETKQLAEISLYMFEEYRKEFFTSGKHHVAVPQFHHWLHQLISEKEDTYGTN